MNAKEDQVVVPVAKLLDTMGKDPSIAEQLRRAGEQESIRKKLRENAHLKRLFAHHPETILHETRMTISNLTHVIAQVLGQRGVGADWFGDVTDCPSAQEVVSSPVTYLRKAMEIAAELSPERDKLDALMAKDPVIIETAKVSKLAEMAKAGKITDAQAKQRILRTSLNAEKNRRTHIVRKYELELMAVWGRELQLIKLRREVLDLESAILYKLRSSLVESIAELVKIAETPEAEELLEQARTLRMQASLDERTADDEPTNLAQIQEMRGKVQESEDEVSGRLETNEETIRQLVEMEQELLQLMPTIAARHEWKPVHRPAKKSAYSTGAGPKVKHRGRMVSRRL